MKTKAKLPARTLENTRVRHQKFKIAQRLAQPPDGLGFEYEMNFRVPHPSPLL
jgi:hypothetical protein